MDIWAETFKRQESEVIVFEFEPRSRSLQSKGEYKFSELRSDIIEKPVKILKTLPF